MSLDVIRSRAEQALCRMIAALVQVPARDIDVEAELIGVGLDSASLTEFCSRLNQAFGLKLSPTIFFELPTVRRLAAHLVERYEPLREKFAAARTELPAAAPAAPAADATTTQSSAGALVEAGARRRRRPASWKAARPTSAGAPAIEPVAIIGMSGRFPGAPDLETFWENLAAGKDCMVEIPASRWDWRAFYGDPSAEANKTHVRFGGFIDGIEEFDPLFFGISPREAELMDPQQRLLMMYAWRAIEDAGYAPRSLSGTRTAIFVGTASSGYSETIAASDAAIDGYSATGMVPSVGPNRMSFLLNLHGPSEPIETACSSALVAIHRAVRAMQVGDCDMALAGGVNLMVSPLPFIGFSKAGMLSEDGRCKTFSKHADGYARGEGVGMLLLKRLSAAERDRDHIHGVIRASSENHGGRASSLTAPNPRAQAELIKTAYREARLDPRTVTYIEAHGTGTPLGDPIEIEGLKSAFAELCEDPALGSGPAETGVCGIGSVKTNIGHLELAAGVAGVIKVLLQLRHRTLAKTLHCEEINPYIQLQDSPFFIVTETQPWNAKRGADGADLPRRAGVSSFGFGGVNAHVVIEEYCESQVRADARAPAIPAMFVLSAKTQERLREHARRLQERLQAGAYRETDLLDIAYTLQVGRDAMEHRLGFSASTLEEASRKLAAFAQGGAEAASADIHVGEARNNREALALFNRDDLLKSAVGEWLKRGELGKFLDLWVKGLAFDWTQLYGEGALYGDVKPRRLSLPTYPFARDRYWIDTAIRRASPPAEAVADDALEDAVAADVEADDECDTADGRSACDPAKADAPQETALPESVETHLLRNVWQESPSRESAPNGTRVPAPARSVLVAPAFACHQADVRRYVSDWDVLRTASESGSSVADCVQQVFERVQSLLRALPKQGALLQVVIPSDGSSATDAALRALLRSATQENPKLTTQLIELPSRASAAELVQALQESAAAGAEGDHIRYVAGVREQSSVQEVSRIAGAEQVASLWKNDGVYLITGGAGGLGLIVARDIAASVEGATIVLAGRSAPSAKQCEAIEAVRRIGHRTVVEYIDMDVTRGPVVSEVISAIVECHGALNGIVHCAGLRQDNFLIRKTADELRAVLAPKVSGAINLDRATASLDMDFMLLFSSMSGVWGGMGQADYAFANAFLDCFAERRNRLVKEGERSGRTLSVAWPLWQDGGMRMDETVRAGMERLGLHSLSAAEGVQALHRAWASGCSRVVVLRSTQKTLDALLGRRAQPGEAQERRAVGGTEAQVDEAQLKEQVLARLKTLFAGIARLTPDQLDPGEALEHYGIDSIMIVRLNEELGRIFGGISKTLFYEHPTLAQLSEHLASEYRERCLTWTGLSATPAPAPRSAPAPKSKPRTRRPAPAKAPKPSAVEAPGSTVEAPRPAAGIAIIGLAGRYPGGRTLQEYWQNLRDGKDCVGEVPQGRWFQRDFYEPDVEKAVNQGRSYCKWGGFLEGFAEFDALFFHISPLEAANMDPQERLFLQTSWAVLEDAGYTRQTLAARHRGRVGVYAGITKAGFNLYGPALWEKGERAYPQTNFSSVANRVSYLLNLHGPSVPVDTMCSASLTAVHMACESLSRGECELAIAGGVNLYLHPSSYAAMCGMRMLSSEGRCKSFGAGGDGFVPGEGVGAVLLKPLEQAVADRDHVYGVIRATSINHGGKTNGYTVPNPTAQRDLIAAALEKGRIDPRTISYIEAHGTGTSLGDPIEIAGLTQAFSKYTQDRQYCAIGSAKSNIGHLESAAGIAGLTKVLLQLKHRTLVPSLHAQPANPNIDFTRTPFTVQRELAEWKRPVIGDREYPRLAGISSFGAGGSNAHVIVEEYSEDAATPASPGVPGQPALIVLSARTAGRLQEQARQLLEHVAAGMHEDADLTDIAYTLQVGREAMEHRLAFTAATLDELREKLAACAAATPEGGVPEGCYRGEVKKNREALAVFTADEDLQRALTAWLEKGKYARLLELWVKGLAFDWTTLYGAGLPRRISLPTYPFARDQYWIETEDLATTRSGAAPALHPLAQRNTSTLSEQRFSSTLSAEESYLSDHVVHGRRQLPPAAYLEMARAAFVLSSDRADADAACVELRDIEWQRPLNVEAPCDVHIALEAGEDSAASFEIYTQGAGEDEITVHASGEVAFGEIAGAERIDLTAMESLCRSVADVPKWYSSLDAAGIHRGEAHRSLTRLKWGEDSTGRRVALARLELPPCVSDTHARYVLHPSLIDGVFQACMVLTSEGQASGASGRPTAPCALEALQLMKPIPRAAVVVVREISGPGEGAHTLSAGICDESGNVCVRLGRLSLRADEHASDLAPLGAAETGRPVLLVPRWVERALPASDSSGKYAGQWVWLDPAFRNYLPELQRADSTRKWAVLEGAPDGAGVLRTGTELFGQLQQIAQGKPADAVLLQAVLCGDGETLGGSVAGLLKTAQHENPRLIGQVIELEPEASVEKILAVVRENAGEAARADQEVRYRSGVREALQLQEPAATADASSRPWKDGGVYLITGGAGGLGLIFAREIATSVKGARIVLTGRSALGGAKSAALEELRQSAPGARIEYRVLDVTDAEAVRECVRGVMDTYGALDGVIHAAGVIHDNFILRKPLEEVARVMRPKVLGTIHLDEATRDVKLDWMILFSSIAATFGSIGQADYAMANAFMDRYAAHRSRLQKQGLRHGRTLSIDWPLWASGGMQVDDGKRAVLRRRGLESLSTADGTEALYRAWRSDTACAVVLSVSAQAASIPTTAAPATAVSGTSLPAASLPAPGIPSADSLQAANQAPNTSSPDGTELRERTVQYLKKRLSRVLKVPPDRLDAEAGLEAYGIDSILALRLVGELEQSFGPLPKTLMFEYQSIDALASYFVAHHRASLTSHLKLGEPAATLPSKALASPTQRPSRALSSRRRRLRERPRETLDPSDTPCDVAIIGLGGRYPGARNLEEYWENLKAGRDCITEVPKDRWDHSQYYHPEKGQFGKTYSRWGGFMDGVDRFDALFFNMSPREASWTDPQERLFLQCVYETLEDAGYTRAALKACRANGLDGNVGVFVGVLYEEYQLYGAQAQVLGEQPYALSSNPSSIANRVSYFCNFHGPSMALDTMCSGSLTAIHLACESLRNRGCEVAIAGGVNLSIHPNKYLVLAQGQFVSSSGRCESFGKGGDGYVPGEGVGAVLLKPLAQAQADGDHIYAVIKGTSINHGGKTNGYTVPNPVAQAQVISQALKQSGVDARAISYIEAHGTGTSLGDPIEISGLTQAFSQYTQDRQYCAIGSAKSNIGHLESAAGIAALTKVLLQMKHGQLVPSLHSQELNPHIDFASTPFRVQQSLAEWQRPVLEVNGVRRECPRIAGISSFGAGGSNAHVIVEEYRAETRPAVPVTHDRRALIVLSAKSEEQLKEQAQRLLGYLGRHGIGDEALYDMAYTLQVGREAFDHRLAFPASSVGEVQEKLTAVVEDRASATDCYLGEIRQNRDTLSLLNTDASFQQTVSAWVGKGQYSKILDLWAKGLSFDWSVLYGPDGAYSAVRPRRMSLPTYPFAGERHWVPELKPRSAGKALAATVLHPLLQRNTSCFSEQRFSSVFTGEELYLSDHVIGGARVLPGVAYLEMARAAVVESLGNDGKAEVALRDVVWLKPLAVSSPLEVHIGLAVDDQGEIQFQVYTGDGAEEARCIHAQGTAFVTDADEPRHLDLATLRDLCDRSIEPEQCYAAFSAMGIEYGAAHRAIGSLHLGTDADGQRFVLAQVRLPACASDTEDRYVLHPSVLDGALQAAIGLSLEKLAAEAPTHVNPMLPFSLDDLQVAGRSPQTAWVVIRSSGQDNNVLQKLDIDVCDESGRVCVGLQGFTSRVLEMPAQDEGVSQTVVPTGAVTMTPYWEPVVPPSTAAWPETSGKVLLVGGTEVQRQAWRALYPDVEVLSAPPDASSAIIEEHLPAGRIDHVIWLAPPAAAGGIADDGMIAAQTPGVVSLYRLIKALLALGHGTESLGFTVVTWQAQGVTVDEEIEPTHASVHGLVGSLAKEYANWQVRLVDLPVEDRDAGEGTLIRELLKLPADPQGNAWAYRAGEWYRQQLVPCELPAPSANVYRENGVYVLIGGAGGLGEVFSEHLIRRYQARVVWIGRREADEAIQAKIARLAQLGSPPVYLSADATDREALERAYRTIRTLYGRIDGVVHSAITLLDRSLAQMEEAQFLASLSAKVDVAVRIAQVFGAEPLDFVLFFSSLQSFVKAPGQGNYAAGCTFKDAFALRLAQTLACPVKVMNWGYWGSVGIVASERYRARMAQMGVASIEPEEGMVALASLMAAPVQQLVFFKTQGAAPAHTGPERAARSHDSRQATPAGAPADAEATAVMEESR